MSTIRKKHNKQIKFKAALALVKSEKTALQISQEFGIHQSVLQRWKKILLDTGSDLFDDGREKKIFDNADREALQCKVGQLTMELDFLKKALGQ